MKAHQRIIREEIANKRSKPSVGYFFSNQEYPEPDIKKAVLKEVSRKEAKDIILKYEWLGTMGITKYYYGIFYDNYLAGVVCFGPYSAMNKSSYISEKYRDFGIQLTRGACTHWSHPHSGSKLIAYGLRQMKKKGYKFVVAFSDPSAGEIGTVYQATNWYYLGFGPHNKHFNIIYKESGKVWMNDRDLWEKYGFCGAKKVEEKIIANRPYLEIKFHAAKARYIKLIGSKRENKEMFSLIADKILPYPKRN